MGLDRETQLVCVLVDSDSESESENESESREAQIENEQSPPHPPARRSLTNLPSPLHIPITPQLYYYSPLSTTVLSPANPFFAAS